MKIYEIGTCGYYDTKHTIANGQTIKTIAVTEQIIEEIGEDNVTVLDYSQWHKNAIKAFVGLVRLFSRSKNVLLFPADNAIKYLAPLAIMLRLLFHANVYYVVIGGWLPQLLQKNTVLKKCVRCFDGLFVETKALKQSLNECGVKKLYITPNFKRLSRRKTCCIDLSKTVLRMIFLSRIEEKKGVSEMIDVVKRVNKDGILCTLDIYGPVQSGFKKAFDEIVNRLPSYIRYGGILNSEQINDVIVNYDVQLFPTKYITEGFPGSILDSFYAGVPVIASNWNSASDVIDDLKDGLIFRFCDYNDMYNKIKMLINDEGMLNKLKMGSREKGDAFSANVIVKKMLSLINKEECANE